MRMLTSWWRAFPTVCRRARMAALRVRKKRRHCGSRRFLEGIPRPLGPLGEFRRGVRRVAPEALQTVEAAAVLGEDMHDEVAEIEQDPAAGRRPLHQQRLDVQL